MKNITLSQNGTASLDAQPSLEYKGRWMALAALVIMTLMSCIDASIVNVTLPTMSDKLHVDMSMVQWVVTSYLIGISGLILIFGRIGDIKGRTNVFKAGIVIFTVASLLCGMSRSLPFLVAARLLQAVGAACTNATMQGIITQMFSSKERGRALGLNGSFVALGFMLGPPLGGLITQYFAWEYIFLINVPLGIVAFLMCAKFLPREQPQSSQKFDFLGAILLFAAISILCVTLNGSGVVDFSHPTVFVPLIIAISLAAIFIYVEKHTREPLLNLEIFKNKLFSLSVFCSFISFVALNCTALIFPFYWQDVLKLSPGTTGMYMMFSPVLMGIIAPLSGHLSDKVGSEILTFIGQCICVAGFVAMTTINQFTPPMVAVAFILIVTLGNAMFQSPNTSLIMSSVARDKLGVAGSVNGLVRNIGQIIGVIVSMSVLYSQMSAMVGYKVTDYIPGRDDVFVHGMRYAFFVAAGLCSLGAILTASRLFRKKRTSQ